jgi:hypothetical protein
MGWEAEELTGIGDLGDFVAIVAIPTQGSGKSDRVGQLWHTHQR